jgi:hypothetical protein
MDCQIVKAIGTIEGQPSFSWLRIGCEDGRYLLFLRVLSAFVVKNPSASLRLKMSS